MKMLTHRLYTARTNLVWLTVMMVALLGVSGVTCAQEDTMHSPPGSKSPGGCSVQTIVDKAQAGACMVEKGGNYTKILAAGRIVALLPENITNADRCQEVLETVVTRCAKKAPETAAPDDNQQ